MLNASLNFPPPPPIGAALRLFARIIVRVIATGMGSLGVYALVCSALHPHPDAALMAIVLLTGAMGLTVRLSR